MTRHYNAACGSISAMRLANLNGHPAVFQISQYAPGKALGKRRKRKKKAGEIPQDVLHCLNGKGLSEPLRFGAGMFCFCSMPVEVFSMQAKAVMS